MPTRLERSNSNRVVAGVCGGIAEYLQIDATLVRVFFVIGTLLTAGAGLLAYIVLIVLMPLPGQRAPFVQGSAAGDPAATATTPVTPPPPPDPEATERRRMAFGYFLVAVGAVFLLSNVGIFRVVRWDLVWPIVLIGVGVLLLVQRVRR